MARQFTEKQAARILRRASELQAGDGLDAFRGLGAEDVERIGREVGLDPSHVRRAIEEFASGAESDPQTRWLGAPPSYEVERIVAGSVSEEDWLNVVDELNATFHHSIQGESSGPIRTWLLKREFGSVRFSAAERHGSTRLTIVSHIDEGISTGFVITILAMIVSIGTLAFASDLPSWIGVPLSVAAVIGLGLFYRTTTANWFKRDRVKISKLMDRLESLITGSSPSVVTGQVQPAEPETQNLMNP